MRPDARNARDTDPVRLLSLVIADDGHVALPVAGPDRWRDESGYTFVPLELPGGPAEPNESAERALQRIASARLGRSVRPLSSPWTYCPSATHAIDRRSATAGQLCPVLEIARAVPLTRDDSAPGLEPVVVRAYRASLTDATPLQRVSVLWLTPNALRAVVRGQPLGDLLALPDVRWQPAGETLPPDDALIYVPSEYGERYLLRAVAKYGWQAVIPEERAHESR